MKALFVCTGNTCRSPMAQAILQKRLKDLSIEGVTAESAGINAVGEGVNPYAAATLNLARVPFDDVKSKALTKEIFDSADLVVAMTAEQAERINMMFGAQKAMPMSAFCGYDIPDPFGKGMEAYEETFRLLSSAMPRLIDLIVIKAESAKNGKTD